MKQHVNVIFDSANGNRHEINVMADSRKVSPQWFLNVLGDDFPALFGAEHHVVVTFGEGMRHRACTAPAGA
jgi:hypothetical protein